MKKLFFLVAFFYALLNTTYAQTITGGTSFLSATNMPTFNEVHTMVKDTTDKYLKFDLQQGEGVTVALTGHLTTGSMRMYLYTPENQSSYFSYSSSAYNTETEVVSFTAQTSGTYYIKITGSAGLADIAVYQSFYTQGVSDASRDFYATFNTAKYLSEGNHDLNNIGYSNYYRFEAQIGDTVSISVAPHLMSGSVSMYAYTPDNQDNYFTYDTSIYDGQTGTVSFTAQVSGTYYIRVSAGEGNIDLILNGVRADNDTDNDGLNNSVEYVRGTSIDSSDTNKNGISDYNEAIAGNIGKYMIEWTRADMSLANSSTAAKRIPYFNELFSFAKDTTDKYLKFDLQEGEGVTVALTGHLTTGSMRMYLYTPENQSSYFSYSSSAYNGETEVVSFTAQTSGTHYVKITGNAGRADISIYQSFTTSGVSDASRDFYSSFNTAKYLSEGNHHLNNIANYYRFVAQIGDTVSISVAPHLMSGSVSMYAYTPENQNNYFAYDTSIYDGQTGTISFTAYSPGVYYIKLSNNEGSIDFALSGIRLDTDGDNILDENDLDDDNDGMPDTFEETHGLDSKDSSDKDTDMDDDGVSNYDEYRAGTDPEDPTDYLGTPLANPAVIMFLLG